MEGRTNAGERARIEFPHRYMSHALVADVGAVLLFAVLTVIVAAEVIHQFRLLPLGEGICAGGPYCVLIVSFASLLVLAPAALSCFYTQLVVRTLLEHSRAGVVLGNELIEITDWRGRQRPIRLRDVSALYVGKPIPLLTPPTVAALPRVVLHSGRDRYALSPHMVDREVLVQEMIARAGLSESERNWRGTLYTRVSPSDGARHGG